MTPRRPISASLGRISDGKREASSHSITCGAISPSANARTLRRSCVCSSVNAKSTMPPAGQSFVYRQTKFILYQSGLLPADRVVVLAVLLVEPGFQWREVVRQRGCIHLVLA